MARKFVVALVFFALLGMAFAEAANAPEEASTPKEGSAAPAPSEGQGGVVGNKDDNANDDGAPSPTGAFAEAAPVGGPIPASAFEDTPTDTGADAAPPKSGASSLVGVAPIGAAVITSAAFSLFYF